ncbi:hypothetical protein O3G_MSEX014217, partial [Manduca sexta]
MSETANSEGLVESEKPVTVSDEVKFPPFPEPTDKDFEEDVPEEERIYYKNKFPDLSVVKSMRLHCTSCDRHLGSSARNVSLSLCDYIALHVIVTWVRLLVMCLVCALILCCERWFAILVTHSITVENLKKEMMALNCTVAGVDKVVKCIAVQIVHMCFVRMTYKTEDPKLRELYQKDCAQDYTECCKHKNKRKEKESRKKDPEHQTRKSTAAASIISKIPPTIQVKKFASMSTDETAKPEKIAVKRPSSPKSTGIFIKNPIAIAPGPRLLNPISFPSPLKKIK